MRVLAEDQTSLVAVFEVRAGASQLEVIMHSAGGAGRAGGVPRNRDYPKALELLLRRLRDLDGDLLDAFVDSQVVVALPLEDRRLALADRTYPVRLRSEVDMHELRLAITRAQGPVGRAPDVQQSRGGNERKRIRLLVAVPGFVASARDAGRLELALAGSAVAPASAPQPHGRSSPRGGQGRSADSAFNAVVEAAAVKAATKHYDDAGWHVEDVGAFRSYDLHCTRGNEVCRVEVKGTTTAGADVRLTPNEVAHAAAGGPIALFVLSGLVVDRSSEIPTCSGGEPFLLDPWVLEAARLAPTGYTYSLET